MDLNETSANNPIAMYSRAYAIILRNRFVSMRWDEMDCSFVGYTGFGQWCEMESDTFHAHATKSEVTSLCIIWINLLMNELTVLRI